MGIQSRLVKSTEHSSGLGEGWLSTCGRCGSMVAESRTRQGIRTRGNLLSGASMTTNILVPCSC